MAGAAILCGTAALRGGAGLVQVACPLNVQSTIAAGFPSYTTFGFRVHADGTLPDDAASEVVEWGREATTLAVGPGLGRGNDVAGFVTDIIDGLPRTPVVLDADGLNAVAPFTNVFKERCGALILTPHPGEFHRLSGVAMPEVAVHREELAVEFAAKFNVILLLKGAGTLVTDGKRLFRNSTGNPGMATGGAGDVLTGVISALVAQELEPFDAAALGAWVHGRAGDLAAAALGQTALTSADLLNYLPAAFRELEQRG
jgi:NAD(P)H-hydrate epimerase